MVCFFSAIHEAQIGHLVSVSCKMKGKVRGGGKGKEEKKKRQRKGERKRKGKRKWKERRDIGREKEKGREQRKSRKRGERNEEKEREKKRKDSAAHEVERASLRALPVSLAFFSFLPSHCQHQHSPSNASLCLRQNELVQSLFTYEKCSKPGSCFSPLPEICSGISINNVRPKSGE